MNKFLQKLAKIFLGLSLAAGVGVAVGSNSKEASRVDATAVTGSGTGSLTFSSDHKVASSGDTLSDTAGATYTFTTDSDYIALDGGSMKLSELMERLQLSGRDNFIKMYLKPAQVGEYVSMTIPDKPTSKNQAYYLSEKGLAKLRELKGEK